MSQSPVHDDPELARITAEEEQCLVRTLQRLDARETAEPTRISYDEELISLRDQISSARTEDIPPLLEQMERLQAISARQTETGKQSVNVRSPYFGRMVLAEDGRRREVLIGRGTYIDTRSGVRIVDWRDAPVSRLFYRYAEGEEYDEVFGEKEVTGAVLSRRSVTITERELRRIQAPQGNFARSKQHGWIRLEPSALRLAGGQGTATRAEGSRSQLGVGDAITENDDKHLKEITPLIDARQFELITSPDSGLVVIQGGAGSGKTTIGLHRLAYLAFHDPRRFRPDRMLVVVFNEALVRYISQVLPSLGLKGVSIRTYQDWAARLRASALPRLPRRYSDDTPGVVTRFKKHPAMIKLLDGRVSGFASAISAELRALAQTDPNLEPGILTFEQSEMRPLGHRIHGMLGWIDEHEDALDRDVRMRARRLLDRGLERTSEISHVWAETLTDLSLMRRVFQEHAPGEFLPVEIERVHAWCVKQCGAAIAQVERDEDAETSEPTARDAEESHPVSDEDQEEEVRAIDGLDIDEHATLDREDDTLLLRLLQRIIGPLRKGQAGKEALVYEHVLVDEAQDLSPVELAVIFATISKGQSVTLAGDTAQRLHMDNGFSGWKELIGHLGMSHVEVEPLKLSYRSTAEILELANHVLGPLAPEETPVATRHGAPVELFQSPDTGDSVAFLAEALRELALNEPRASVAVVARYPEQADLYYDGLKRGDVPYLRRIADQDFPFRPGVDVTDIRQVKGLEFDYVILVEVTESSYPVETEARHLLHIGATRAAHQLWILSSSKPSLLLPETLRDRGY